MLDTTCLFYLCPICFATSETAASCHERAMIQYNACQHDARQRRPVVDSAGRLKASAPRWVLEAIGKQQLILEANPT